MIRAVSMLLSAIFVLVSVNRGFAGVSAGDRIRVTRMGGVYVVGYLESTQAAAVTLRTTSGGMTFSIPFSQVNKLEVSRGFQSQARKGALVGGGVGLLTGLIVVLVVGGGADMGGGGDVTTAQWIEIEVGLAATGFVIGGLIGLVSEAEKWERVQLDEFESTGH